MLAIATVRYASVLPVPQFLLGLRIQQLASRIRGGNLRYFIRRSMGNGNSALVVGHRSLIAIHRMLVRWK
jgi:hypothetical protein